MVGTDASAAVLLRTMLGEGTPQNYQSAQAIARVVDSLEASHGFFMDALEADIHAKDSILVHTRWGACCCEAVCSQSSCRLADSLSSMRSGRHVMTLTVHLSAQLREGRSRGHTNL